MYVLLLNVCTTTKETLVKVYKTIRNNWYHKNMCQLISGTDLNLHLKKPTKLLNKLHLNLLMQYFHYGLYLKQD